jgi:hypothetical protein
MDDPGAIAAWGLAFRIGERLVISAVVILVCLVVTVGFWRSIQKLDFTFSRDKISGAANVVLATPVFALLALILFAWVSFSHPVTVSVPAAGGKAGDETAEADVGGVKYVGAVPSVATGGDVSFERRRAEEMVKSLNCVAIAAGTAVSPREADALAEARLAALLPVWSEDWGEQAAFRAWALGRSTAAPDPEAEAVFAAAHPEC